MTITSSYRWPMKSNLQQSNGMDALFKSTTQQIFSKCDPNLPNMCFWLSIWPNEHRESHKYDWIPRTNEAAGLIHCPLHQLKSILVRMRIAYSVPEVHELVAQSWYPRRWSCLERVNPVSQARTGPIRIWRWSTGFGSSSARSRPFELSFWYVHWGQNHAWLRRKTLIRAFFILIN